MNAAQHILMRLQQAILERDASAARDDIAPHSKLSAEARIAIYRDGYVQRLSEAVAADYPATRAAIGEAVFDAWARAFVAANPSRHYSLDPYPLGFAAWLERAADASRFVKELAQLEATIAEVFLLPDSPLLDSAACARLDETTLSASRFRLRTASALKHFSYPLHAYLTAERAGQTPSHPLPNDEYLLLVRHRNEVQRHVLSPAAYAMLLALRQGAPFGEALSEVSLNHPEALARELGGWMQHWLQHGFFTALVSAGDIA
jgi:hypothetical protein